MNIAVNGIKFDEVRQDIVPVKVVDSFKIEDVDNLYTIRDTSVSFAREGWTIFQGNGSYVVLDFGKEMCGGIRIITRSNIGGGLGNAKWRLTFGESLSEAYSSIGENNATNDHSPRDFVAYTSGMSDLQFGQTGFRFVRLEVLEGGPIVVQNIYAVSLLPDIKKEGTIVTNDTLINQIIDTAVYTLKLNFQNGHIWDGIKRDRLVWCGDLNPEILTGLYMFGDSENIKNSLLFLRGTVGADEWINEIPTYSAWWVINLCDYAKLSGNWDFFHENKDYALGIIAHFAECVNEDGRFVVEPQTGMDYFLDWSTHGFPDAEFGSSSLIRLMAMKYLELEANEDCEWLIKKLENCTNVHTTMKPVRAFQIIAGRSLSEEDQTMLEEDGAKGFSTFMAYYILTAMAKAGSTNMIDIIKTYYGGMLSRGATSFWEDFDIEWLEGSGRIDELPKDGEKDIHGDFGKFCYKQLRHSLCHGWASGVVAFIVEYVLGLTIKDGGKEISVQPKLSGLTDIEAHLPITGGWLDIEIHGDDVKVEKR